jgi:hypothetical protein
MPAIWMQLYCVRSCFSKWQPLECTSIVSGHAFQNASPLNAPLLCQVMLFKMPALWMHLHCARSCFSKCLPFECTSIAPGHAFQNACHLNAPLVRQVMLFKMAAIWNWMHLYFARSRFSKCQPFKCTSIVSGHTFQNASPLKAPPLRQVMLFKMPAIWMHL